MSDENKASSINTQDVELELMKKQIENLQSMLAGKASNASTASAETATAVTPTSVSVEDVHKKLLDEKKKDEDLRESVRREFELESKLDTMIKDLSSDHLNKVNDETKKAGVTVSDRYSTINKLALQELAKKFAENNIITAAIKDIKDYDQAKAMIERLNTALPTPQGGPNASKKQVGDLSHLIAPAPIIMPSAFNNNKAKAS